METGETSDDDETPQPAISGHILEPVARAEAYRNLKNRVETLQESEDAGITAAIELNAIFDTLVVLTQNNDKKDPKHQQKIDEYVLDATIINTGSEILIKCVDGVINEAAPYEPTEYANNLLHYTEESEDVFGERSNLMLMNVARRTIQSVPEYNSMYGSFDPGIEFLPKVQKQRQRESKIEVRKQHLKQVKVADVEEDSIEHTLVFMYKVLKDEFIENNGKPIQYLKFVVDSESFAKTVSNMFYFSFLIKDGRAGIDVVEHVAYIWPLKKGQFKKLYEDGGENSQFISSIDMQDWRNYCQAGPGYLQNKKKSWS